MSTLKVFIKEYSEEMNKNFAPEKIDITRQVEFSVKAGYDFCQKEYEEKLRWIPVEERLPEIGIWIIIQLKNQSLKNKYVTMLPKNDFEINFIKENVISWRSFL